ncbi:hypothetical protein LSTR_LSTR007996 [Laodelphax striatellus]|uniref:SET domain-containing protein n=1 Tax=Laodelphax striatellus TaxID=195883 RepID=A0A482X473_LAOST|nr:hypothetical protein LSTR_LSTR007996 [Laodelphax striatellus]
MSSRDDDMDLEKYFLPIEWSEMSQLEKTRAQNILDNYLTMKSFGIQPQEPYFIKDYRKRKAENTARLLARVTPPPAKKVYRVNEGASTSRGCSDSILDLESVAANSNSTASNFKSGAANSNASNLKLAAPNLGSSVTVLQKSSRKPRPSINVEPPSKLSVRLDIEKYFSEQEWARKSQVERDGLRAELETYSLHRTFGKDPEPPYFVIAYKERKIKQIQETREKILAAVGKGPKIKKSSKPTSNTENANQNLNSDNNVNSKKSSNDDKSQKTAQTNISAVVSRSPDVPKEIGNKSNQQSVPPRKLKIKSKPKKGNKRVIVKKIFAILKEAEKNPNNGPSVAETLGIETNSKILKVINMETAFKILDVLKKFKNRRANKKKLKNKSNLKKSDEVDGRAENPTNPDTPKKLKNKSNNNADVPKKLKTKSNSGTSTNNETPSVSVSTVIVSQKSNNELEVSSSNETEIVMNNLNPGTSGNEPECHELEIVMNNSNPETELENSTNEPETVKNISNPETSEASDNSLVFKIPALPKKLKNNANSNSQVSVVNKTRLAQMDGIVVDTPRNLRKKMIKEQKARIIKEKQKKEKEDMIRTSKSGYIWNEFWDQTKSMTFEETDDLVFTEAETKLSITIYHAVTSLVRFPSRHDIAEEGDGKEETDKKKNEDKKKKSKVKSRVKTQSAEASTGNTSDRIVVNSTAQDQNTSETKRRYPKRNVPVKNYAEPENINMDDFVFCDVCGREWFKQCNVHGKMINIPDIPVDRRKAGDNYAKETTPRILGVAQSKIVNAGKGVWTRDMIKNQVQFGPYQGRKGKGNPKDPNYAWQLREVAGGLNYVDASDERYSNWMRYVNCARNIHEMNLMAFQFEGAIYYRTFRLVAPHEELFVFYGEQFGSSLGVDVKNFRNPAPTNDKDVSFYCAECNSVFTSPLYLEQHEMKCLLGLGQRKEKKAPALLAANKQQPMEESIGQATAVDQLETAGDQLETADEPRIETWSIERRIAQSARMKEYWRRKRETNVN